VIDMPKKIEKRDFHFYASSAAQWLTTTPERDLRALLKAMDKDKHEYVLFYVPLPHDAEYLIEQVDGARANITRKHSARAFPNRSIGAAHVKKIALIKSAYRKGMINLARAIEAIMILNKSMSPAMARSMILS
jgi:hypothetical protein